MSRIEKRNQRAKSPNFAPAFVKRLIPPYQLLSEEGLQAIESRADEILQEVGIDYRGDDEVLQLFKQAGCDVKGERVRFARGLARQLCQTAPREFAWHSRHREKSVVIGGDNMVFAPVYGAPFVRNLQDGRRYGTLNDFENFVKLAYMAPAIHSSGGVVCEPCDIPVNKRHLRMVYSHIKYSDKPFMGIITARDRCVDSLQLARILYGAEFMDKNAVIMANVNANSPLMIDKVASQAALEYSRANQPIIIAPFILSGAMGPVSVAASVAQALAEAMSFIALTQIIRTGAPVLWGAFLSSMSLRSGAPTFGMPEPVLGHYVIGQLARRLGVPLRTGGCLTAAKLPDAQSAYESADSMHSTVLAGANFVLHSAGWLESGLVASYEKFVLDADRLGAYCKMSQGVAVDDNGLARGVYDEVPPAGHFLGCTHTMNNYETAFYESPLADIDSYEQWRDNGQTDTAARANQYYLKQLQQYTPPKLDPAIDEELLEYIHKTESAQPDAWY